MCAARVFHQEQRATAICAILRAGFHVFSPEPSAMNRIAANTAKSILGLAALAMFATQAGAASARVQAACAGDYFAYCSQHPTEGPGVRACMRANGIKLSKGCVNALISAGEVSKAEVDRRAAAGR
jgi:hypothetical protein